MIAISVVACRCGDLDPLSALAGHEDQRIRKLIVQQAFAPRASSS
jgi:hypothetical protein